MFGALVVKLCKNIVKQKYGFLSASFFQIEDLTLNGEAERVKVTTRHKQGTELKMEQLNIAAVSADKESSMYAHLTLRERENSSRLVLEDYDMVGGSNKNFPKGAVRLEHYTGSGLFIAEQKNNGVDEHQPTVALRLRRWGANAPEKDDVAKFFAETTSTKKSEEKTRIGFAHMQSKSGIFVMDGNESPDKNQMICGIIHHADKIGPDEKCSHMQIEDITVDGGAKQVKMLFHHKLGSELKLDQINETPGDMEIDFHHFKKAGYKVVNAEEDVTLTIYHPSGSEVKFDKDGNIFATSIKSLTAKAAEKATIEAPDIELIGAVKVIGSLDVIPA